MRFPAFDMVKDPAVRAFLQQLKMYLEPLVSSSDDAVRLATLKQVSDAIDAAVPNSGEGVVWAMDADRKYTPKGWVFCNGEQETPDMRNRAAIGDGDTYVLGDKGADYYALTFIKKR